MQTFDTQSCPAGQSPFCVHCGFASVSLQHTPSLHTGMRASIVTHPALSVQGYRQYPFTHTFDVPHTPGSAAHGAFGCGSGMQLPLAPSQISPDAQSVAALHPP